MVDSQSGSGIPPQSDLSPSGSRDERWDGDNWTVEWSSTAIPQANADKRGFDLEYEASSGDALVVYANNTTNPVFRTLSAGAWSTEADVFATPPGSGDVLWVELASRPGTDEVAMIWDGVSWVAIVQVDSNCSLTDRDAAIGWVGNSGTAALVYSDNDGGAEIDWARWTPFLGWSLQPDVPVTGMGNLQAVGIRSCKNQQKLMLVLSDSNSNLYAATYDGFNWVVTNGSSPLSSNIPSLNTEPFSFTVK